MMDKKEKLVEMLKRETQDELEERVSKEKKVLREHAEIQTSQSSDKRETSDPQDPQERPERAET